MSEVNLKVRIKDVEFRNPILLASGTFGYGNRFPQIASKVGGIITKGITLNPRIGNPPPRICEVPQGILNSVGLENPGAKEFSKTTLPLLKNIDTNLIINVAGFSIEEYAIIIKMLDSPQIKGFELNLSCPNVKEGGIVFGQNPKLTYEIVKRVRKVTKKILITKLTANFIDPLLTAKAAEDGGSDAVSLINTVFGLAIDIKTKRLILGGKTGGLSGPAIKPFALYCVLRVREILKIPIIGCGGIMQGKDALEFLISGARLIQIGSANLINPFISLEIISAIKDYLKKNRISDIKRIIGSIQYE